MMTIAQIMEKMIAFSEGNIHDITHLSCVWTYNYIQIILSSILCSVAK